jgi:hypothetical protein
LQFLEWPPPHSAIPEPASKADQKRHYSGSVI